MELILRAKHDGIATEENEEGNFGAVIRHVLPRLKQASQFLKRDAKLAELLQWSTANIC